VHHSAEQIAFYCVSALAGGTMVYLWRRLEEEDRGRMWRLYGWFTALMACGSCFGVVAWTAAMIYRARLFEANDAQTVVEYVSLLALSYRWRAAFLVTYAIEFLCLSAALLMELDRMSAFAAPGMRRRWVLAGRVVMAAVVLGNAVGLAANAAAAVHYQKAAQATSTSSAAYAANNTKDGDYFYFFGLQEVLRGGDSLSVQLFCEVVVLLLIVVVFVAAGVLSARHLTSSLMSFGEASRRVSEDGRLQLSAAAATGRALRLRVVATTAVVFAAFLLRSVFSTMNAVSFLSRDAPADCRSFCDPSCRNVYSVISYWMTYTPEFQLIVMLISSPAALLVALWGMTSKPALRLMTSGSWRGRRAVCCCWSVERAPRELQVAPC
jgi:hypothetical protein